MRKTDAGARRALKLPPARAGDGSLAERIRQFVLARIDSGAWPEGHRIPSETELAHGFGTARMTVHGALHELAAAGYLSRRPGAGTRVARRKPQSTFLEIRDIRDEVIARGHRHTAKVERMAAVSSDLATATELEMAPGAPVFHSLIVHFEDERPIQVESRYVRQAFAPHYLAQDYTRTTTHEYLMSLGPLDEVEHVIQALVPDATTRALLNIAALEPVLQLRRRTWSGGVPVTSARLVHPGEGYSLVGRFRVAPASRLR